MTNDNRFLTYATREEQAINAQRRIYAAKYPAPEKPALQSSIKQLLAGFGIMLIAAIIVSGAHTVPLFQRSIPDYSIAGIVNLKIVVGFAAFTMIEVGMVMLAYARIKHYASTRQDTWERSIKMVSWLIIGATALVFAVALLANIYSTLTLSNQQKANEKTEQGIASLKAGGMKETSSLKIGGINVQDNSAAALFILLGAAAPVLTLLSGEIIGYVYTSESARKEQKEKRWQEEYRAWNDAFLDYYHSKVGRGIWKIESEEVAPVFVEPRLLERPEKTSVIDLQPIKIEVDGKTKYQCPACNKVITRQAWQHHGCRFVN